MFNPIVRKFKYGEHTVTIETGILARQATAAIMINMNDTSVLVTVVEEKKQQIKTNYLPLTISYQERTYAAGKIPGGFFRREGRPSENEILIARLIDRPIRPLFPKGFSNNIQIIATVVSVNPKVNPDIVAIIGASAALSFSGIPFLGPIAASRVAYIDKEYVLNPTMEEMKNSKLDLVLSGTKKAILMVEAESNMLSEEEILNAISFGHKAQQIVIDNICALSNEKEKKNWNMQDFQMNYSLYLKVSSLVEGKISDAYKILEKKSRHDKLNIIKSELIETLCNENIINNELEIENLFQELEKNIVRHKILKKGTRIDGRKFNEIRKLDARIGILPRTHGSALFTRGETQSLVTTTLGTARDAQSLDELLGGDRTENFLFHYNFPPYAVGEIGVIGSPKRREIGHGKLAKKSLSAVMPRIEEFPYTIRIVSEITESNGSSSMASVCGASLALMDAGVPIKSSVAGIAMGLIKEDDKFVILSDIIGDEDHLGDMDFKVAGGRDGITSLQMDMKIEGINIKIIRLSLLQAKVSRLHILDIMEKVIKYPKLDISIFAPRIYILKINPEKIKDLIGKGGSVIRMLTEETGTTIEISDDGTVRISSIIEKKAKNAIRRIKEITAEIEVGTIYLGKITRIVDFGVFVSIGIGKEGLVHISEISKNRIGKISDYLKVNQRISVKVLEIDRQGRLRLSMKETIKK
ncbi:Polyribonucleotide nucleotidyltransferase [Buchnera aphidicola (Tetraneura ulmi)]|uniref:polyribonucleotide nucleotidyltransferase n=1 Tax=Buchnera aphidicola TaxID=9 RepID=UPI003463AC5B